MTSFILGVIFGIFIYKKVQAVSEAVDSIIGKCSELFTPKYYLIKLTDTASMGTLYVKGYDYGVMRKGKFLGTKRYYDFVGDTWLLNVYSYSWTTKKKAENFIKSGKVNTDTTYAVIK